MSKLLESLEKYLRETPREKVMADWARTAEDNIGPTVQDFLAQIKLPLSKKIIYSDKQFQYKQIEKSDIFGFFFALY